MSPLSSKCLRCQACGSRIASRDWAQMNWVLRTQNTRTPDWGLGTELVVRKSVQHIILLPQPWQRERETERQSGMTPGQRYHSAVRNTIKWQAKWGALVLPYVRWSWYVEPTLWQSAFPTKLHEMGPKMSDPNKITKKGIGRREVHSAPGSPGAKCSTRCSCVAQHLRHKRF